MTPEEQEILQTALSKLRVIQEIVQDYLKHGKGGGGRSICLRILQTIEHK